jgi:hypothetical protein
VQTSVALVKPIKSKAKGKLQQRRGSKQHSSSSADAALYSTTGVDSLRQQGLDGSGVLVCVVDTGKVGGGGRASTTAAAAAAAAEVLPQQQQQQQQ